MTSLEEPQQLLENLVNSVAQLRDSEAELEDKLQHTKEERWGLEDKLKHIIELLRPASELVPETRQIRAPATQGLREPA